jgi:hypothetical protein
MFIISPLLLSLLTVNVAAPSDNVTDYPSIQAAIDANPGRILMVPQGEYRITEKIRLRGDHSGLSGRGRIVQTNPAHPIIEAERCHGVLLRDLELTRTEETSTTTTEGVLAIGCRDLVIENVRVLNNRTVSAAIRLRECEAARVSHCLIRNYSRISIDDRRANTELYGYAFHCIDGTGIGISESIGTLIEMNRIVEDDLKPTPELQQRYQLGRFSGKNAVKPPGMNSTVWDAEYVNNWHQGSAIVVTSPEVSRQTRILGNHIQNAAQGIDLHCDQVIVSQNIVDNAFVGMKAMHGSRNVLITGNQFLRNDLWAIGLMPGAAAHPNNSDGGSIIANNIISDFGHGDANWIWGNNHSPLKFDRGQAADDPPLTDVLIQGNVIQAVGPPRYEYTVIIESGGSAPVGLRFSDNLFHPGTAGISNQTITP